MFDDAKKKWEGIFTDESKILLSPSHLSVCVATLQDIKLFNNNLYFLNNAFEYLMSKAQKGEKGQVRNNARNYYYRHKEEILRKRKEARARKKQEQLNKDENV